MEGNYDPLIISKVLRDNFLSSNKYLMMMEGNMKLLCTKSYAIESRDHPACWDCIMFSGEIEPAVVSVFVIAISC